MSSAPVAADGGVADVVSDAERTAFLPPVNEHDPAARRRVAEAAAHAADLRASAAAAEAKAAIAAAARAAELADVAARAAEQADAAVLAATEAEARAADRPGQGPAHRSRADDAVPGEDVAAAGGFPDAVVPVPRPRRDPAAGGRAARRRVASADTAVFAAVPADAGSDAGSDAGAAADPPDAPGTVAEAPVERPTRSASRRARAAVAAEQETAGAEITPRRRGLFRRPTPPVLAAAAAGGVLALTGMLFANTSGNQNPMPAAVIEAAPITAPVVPVLPSDPAVTDEDGGAPVDYDESVRDGEIDVLTHQAATYLRALRAAGVPTSREGVAETEAAELVCGELADGVAEERIARALPASLPTVSRSQAQDLVEIARETYCS